MKVKFVRKANAYCVSWQTQDTKEKKTYQHIEWFPSEADAIKFKETK